MKLPRIIYSALALGVGAFAGCAHPAPAATEPANAIDVYLIGGQSNATGQGYMRNLPPGFVINTRVMLYYSDADRGLRSDVPANTWGPLHQASEDPSRFGPELGFGNRIQELFPHRKIALIKYARSNTNLYAQWNPGANAGDTVHWGPQFRSFVAAVEAGMQGLREQGYTPVIRGMIWHQGENDAYGGANSENYAKNLAHFIARVREQFHASDMLFVYAYVLPSDKTAATYPGRDFVRQAERDLDQDSSSPLAVKNTWVVETADLNHRADDPKTPYPDDYIHIGTTGQLELGQRMADAMKAHLSAD